MSADGGRAGDKRAQRVHRLADGHRALPDRRRFLDEHPDLVEQVITLSEEIERRGLEAYAGDGEGGLEQTFETLLTGLAVRYYKAVAG